MKTVFITGASGYIGGAVAARLLDAGYRVRGLVRSADAAGQLAARNVEPVVGTLDDAPLLAREARAADGVIDAASADHAASAAMLVAALQGTGKPLVHTSGSSVIGDDAHGTHRSDAVFTGETPLVVHPAKQPRRDIDLAVLAAADAGVRSVVICPSLIYGVGRGLNQRSYQIPFLAANAREHGAVQIVGEGANVWSNVHIDDLADLYLLALTKAPAGAFYFAENGEASFAELGRAVAQRLRLPGPQVLDPAIAAQRWGEPKAYFSLGSNSRVRSQRARRELGWAPRHASVIDWVTGEMPDDDATTTQV